MRFRCAWGWLFGLSFLLLVAASLFGQATDSIIVGTVADASGAAVANATVTAANKGTNVKYDTVSNEEGQYRLNNVPVGSYDVSANASGFAMATVADVQLDLNRTSDRKPSADYIAAYYQPFIAISQCGLWRARAENKTKLKRTRDDFWRKNET